MRLRFTFGITVASRDREILEAVRTWLGFGSIRRVPAQRPGHLEQSALVVSSRRTHFTATIPFMERYLLPCARRRQYEEWRDALLGRVTRSPRRKAHYDDELQFAVQSARELVEVVVPFMDAHLPPSHKREQYLEWRSRLIDRWEHRARRRATCTIDDCVEPAMAHGLCRRHLWPVRRQ